MGWVQQISLRFVGTQDAQLSAPPGNPKIWELITEKVGPFVCRRRQSLLLEWNQKPSASFFETHSLTSALEMKALFELTSTETNPYVIFQVKRKGSHGEAMVSLLESWFSVQGIPSHERPQITLVRDFVFSAVDALGKDKPLDPATVPLWIQALESLAGMGSRSGIYDPESEEIRILKPGPWPSSPQVWNPPSNAQELGSYLTQNILEGLHSTGRRKYSIGICKPRSKTPHQFLIPEIYSLLRKLTLPEVGGKSFGSASLGPINLLVSHPQKSDGYSSLEKFRYRCESYASLSDSPLGLTLFRNPSPGPLKIEPLNGLPVDLGFLLDSKKLFQGSDPLHGVGILGFDIRNPILWRRLQAAVTQLHRIRREKSPPLVFEVWEGGQNWVLQFFATLKELKVKSWKLDLERGFEDMLRLNEFKCRYHRLLLFWVEESQFQKTLEILKKFQLESWDWGFEVPKGSDFVLNQNSKEFLRKPWSELDSAKNVFMRATELNFHEQDLKSPTYGFDRPALFPDEYMMKASVRDPFEPQWNQEIDKVYSSHNFRSVLVRGQGSLAIPAFRWSEGQTVMVEAFGTREGWLEVNPSEAGRAALESSLRWLVAMGAEPLGASVNIWTAHPDDFESEKAQEYRTQTHLALEGALKACDLLKLKVQTWNFEGASHPQMKNEIFLGARKPLTEQGVVTFPGFRMMGEVLFMVGPKPAFIDGGSRVLNHITRVFSNHVTTLDFGSQLELYKLLHEFILKGTVTCIRPISEAGLISTLGDMALWGDMGAQIRPTVTTVELFSGSPGRFLVGVLPQEAKKFEAAFKSEQTVLVGTTGGEKIFGLTLQKFRENRMKGESK